jgi:hypothetical protein
MKSSLVIFRIVGIAGIAAAAVFASLYFLTEPATSKVAVTKTKTVVAQPCGDRIYGHIGSLTRAGDHFELRFDPAWFTSGVTANTAAAEDGVVPPGQPVPNDNYVVEEGHRLLTYLLPATAHVTVLAKGGALDSNGFAATAIAVPELERIVNGGNHRPLFEPLGSGVWIRVHVDSVCSLDQQYRP